MLRNCVLPPNYNNKKSSTRCGEIICHGDTNFTIVCVVCKLKIFEFDDFLQHYRNVHLHSKDLPCKSHYAHEADVQKDDFENVEYLAELDGTTDEQQECESQQVRILPGASGHEVSFLKQEFLSDTELENNQSMHASEDERGSVHNFSGDEDDEWQPDTKNDTDEDNDRILKKRKPKEYICNHCPKRYTTERILKLHINMQHLRPKNFKCNQCNEAYSEQRSLESHMRNAHVGFPCSQCDRVYKSAHSLRVHLHSHKETKDFICDYMNCGKAFVSRQRLRSHQKIHTEERNYICEVCGYRTRQKDALVIHKRTHTGEKPFACISCDRCFISASLLNEHKAMHSTDRPHKCDVCGAAFSRAKALYHHKHLHLGVKKFVCKLCGRAYAQMAGLAGHMRQHKMEDDIIALPSS